MIGAAPLGSAALGDTGLPAGPAGDFLQSRLPIALTVLDAALHRPRLPIALAVSPLTLQPRLPIALEVAEIIGVRRLAIALAVSPLTLQPRLPIALAVGHRHTPRLALALAVLASSQPLAGGGAVRWRPVVTLDGADVSDRLVGAIQVEAEEGTARLADLALRPVAGPQTPQQWVGRRVTIDYARMDAAGAAIEPARLFSGLVDVPHIDLAARVVRLRCTDDLPGRLAAADRATLDALIGGSWHAAVFGDERDGLEHARNRLSTVPAALDAAPDGSLRLTPWAARAQPALSFAASQVIDETAEVRFATRDALRNRIDIAYEYRFPRLKRRVASAGYRYPFGFDELLQHGYSIPTRAMIRQALEGTGWEIVGEINYTPLPVGVFPAGGGFFVSDADTAAELCLGFSAALARRYSQQVIERYRLTVRADASADAIGELAEQRSGAMTVAFDPDAWERNRWDGPVISTSGAIGERSVDAGHAGVDDRAAAGAAMATLVAQAQTAILAAHRQNAVLFAAPLHPGIDLDKTLRVQTAVVTAQGKVRRLVHRMDLDAGEARTDCELALSLPYGSGVAAPAVPLVPPAPAAPEQGTTRPSLFGSARRLTWVGATLNAPRLNDSMTGYFTNVSPLSSLYSAAAPVYPVQFVWDAPDIEDESRAPLGIEIQQRYPLAIPTDELTVTL